MLQHTFLVALLVAISHAATAPSWIPFNTTSYTNALNISLPNGKTIHLFWKYDTVSIEFGVASNNGATWVGLGISEAGGMAGADIWVGRKNESVY